MKVLLSIKPEYAEMILSGEKLYEYRKVRFRQDVSTVILYATLPVGKLVGEFQLDDIIEETPVEVWERTKKHAGITRDFFKKYFSGRKVAVAFKVGAVTRYPQGLAASELGCKVTPPQSFCYLPD